MIRLVNGLVSGRFFGYALVESEGQLLTLYPHKLSLMCPQSHELWEDVTSDCLVPKCNSMSNKGLIEGKPGSIKPGAIKRNINFYQGHGPASDPKAPLLVTDLPSRHSLFEKAFCHRWVCVPS